VNWAPDGPRRITSVLKRLTWDYFECHLGRVGLRVAYILGAQVGLIFGSWLEIAY